jgi:hypothetical protein
LQDVGKKVKTTKTSRAVENAPGRRAVTFGWSPPYCFSPARYRDDLISYEIKFVAFAKALLFCSRIFDALAIEKIQAGAGLMRI